MAAARILMVTIMVSQVVCAGQVRKQGAQAGVGLELSKDTVYADEFFGQDFRDTCLLRNTTGAQLVVDTIKNVSEQALCPNAQAVSFLDSLIAERLHRSILFLLPAPACRGEGLQYPGGRGSSPMGVCF